MAQNDIKVLALLLRSSGEILESASAGLCIPGRALGLRPTMRWECVRGSSRSSEETYEMGRQFKIISASVTTVTSSSQESLARPIVFLRHLFSDLTSRS